MFKREVANVITFKLVRHNNSSVVNYFVHAYLHNRLHASDIINTSPLYLDAIPCNPIVH